jgi:ABC-type uncharacterized transport system substrate-binding protein
MARTRPGFRILLMGLIGLCVLLHSADVANSADKFQTVPTTNKGKKWRIGYYEGGPYINYPANLRAIAQGLTELGWMEKTDIADMADPADAEGVWLALAKAKSDYLQFVQEAFYSADWDETLRARNRAAAIDRLHDKQLDFMIAMGTWAGQDLANNLHSVPTMVVSSSDPVKSGIIKSAAQSGFNHVHARCDPNRYLRQVRLFHDIIGFKRLGVVYEDSVAGKSYAALADIEKVAAQRGFKLVTCQAAWSGVTRQVSTQKLIDCHKALAPQIDALFLTVHNGVDTDRMDEILAPLIEHKIPTWSQRGPEEVRQGVLLSVVRGGFQAVGKYHAEIMAKIFNGARPGALNQVFEDPKKIAINLKTAEAIGFKIPRGLTLVADEIYK